MYVTSISIHLTVDYKFLLKAEKAALSKNYDLCLVFNETSTTTLTDIIEENWEEWKTWLYFVQICKGIDYLHKLNLIHTEIKTDNVLIINDFESKVTGFTLAK